MKTNVKLKVTCGDTEQYCRVKLDSKKFPYIIVDNEKIIISSSDFPRTEKVIYGLHEMKFELLSGGEELVRILANPALTVNKLTFKEQMRVA